MCYNYYNVFYTFVLNCFKCFDSLMQKDDHDLPPLIKSIRRTSLRDFNQPKPADNYEGSLERNN